jgi:hypothetical protein
VAERSLAEDLIAVVRPIAVAAVVAAGPMAGAVAVAVEGAGARRIVGAQVGRRGCIESVGPGCIARIGSFGIGGLGLGCRRIGRIRDVGEEVAGIRSMNCRRTIVGVTCRAVDLMLWSLGSAV